MSPNGVGGGEFIERGGGLVTKKRPPNGSFVQQFEAAISTKWTPAFQRGSSLCRLRRVKLQNEDPIEFNVLASNKAFQPSFCSLRQAKLQHEDPIDFNISASNKAFWRRSSFCSLRRVKLQNEDLIDFIVLALKKALQHISFN